MRIVDIIWRLNLSSFIFSNKSKFNIYFGKGFCTIGVILLNMILGVGTWGWGGVWVLSSVMIYLFIISKNFPEENNVEISFICSSVKYCLRVSSDNTCSVEDIFYFFKYFIFFIF